MRFLRVFLSAVLVFCLCPINARHAQAEEQNGEKTEELKANSWRFSNGVPIAEDEISDGDASLSSDAGLSVDYVARGIDVSEWQGDIDWDAVKNSGQVDFAIIRCGFGTTSGGRADYKWERNVSECERVGIPYGVYLYSYATSWDDLNSEVQHTLDLLQGLRPSYPVFFDMEDNSTTFLGKETLTSFGLSFCEQIEEAGYRAGVYSNTNWFTNILDGDRFDAYVKWCAQYNTVCTYQGRYSIWQYSSEGSVPGISGNCDMNYQLEKLSTTESQYSGAYDFNYYVTANPDVEKAYSRNRALTFNHYLTYGIKEGRQASATFDPKFYAERHDDISKAFGTDYKQIINHYLTYGMNEGREGSAVLDPVFYRERYADLQKVYGTDYKKIILHFMDYGMNEGRQGSVVFDPAAYKEHQSDLQKAFGGTMKLYYSHFMVYGMNEGRVASLAFDPAYYKSTQSDLAKAYGNNNKKYYYHFIKTGMKDGRRASVVFDLDYYKNKYEDVAEEYGDTNKKYYYHFLISGVSEACQGSEDFRLGAYYNKNSDLRSAYGLSLKEYYLHFVIYGSKEKREAKNCDTLNSPITSLGGVDYSPVYDEKTYFDAYSDLQKAYTFKNQETLIDDRGLLQHFLDYGMGEKRSAKSSFDVNSYYNEYPDLRAAFGKSWKKYYIHYVEYGQKEGRHTSGCNTLKN